MGCLRFFAYVIVAALLAAAFTFYTRPPPAYEFFSDPVEIPRIHVETYDGTQPNTVRRPVPLAPACQDRFPKLPALAERLGVETAGPGPNATVIEMCDGRAWDIFDIIDAVLDRIDAAAKR